MTLPNLLFAAAARHGNRPFILDGNGVYTYGETAQAVRLAAGRFRGRGIHAGDRVVLCMGNHAAFIVAWFALGVLGAVVVAVNTELRGQTLRDILIDSEARRIVLDESLLPIVEEAAGDELARFDVDSFASPATFFAAIGEAPPVDSDDDADDTTPFTILYSSGTTSRPKGALSSHRAYVLAGRDMAEALALTADDRIYVFLPLYHANPQYYAVASVLHAGAGLALSRRLSLRGFWGDVERYRPTVFTYVGSALALLATLGSPPAPHSLRACVGGGINAELWSFFEERWGLKICELYGMTEVAGFVTTNTVAQGRRGTVGRARDAVELSIVRDGTVVPTGDVGEIVVRARIPHAIFEEYIGIPREETFGPLGFRTGDLGKVDADGFYTFLGRAKEMLRVRGENISPSYLESLLSTCPLIREVAAVGIPNASGDDELKLCVVPDGAVTPEAIAVWCAQELPRFMRPHRIELRDSLPKTATLKVLRRELVQTPAGATVWEAPR